MLTCQYVFGQLSSSDQCQMSQNMNCEAILSTNPDLESHHHWANICERIVTWQYLIFIDIIGHSLHHDAAVTRRPGPTWDVLCQSWCLLTEQGKHRSTPRDQCVNVTFQEPRNGVAIGRSLCGSDISLMLCLLMVFAYYGRKLLRLQFDYMFMFYGN